MSIHVIRLTIVSVVPQAWNLVVRKEHMAACSFKSRWSCSQVCRCTPDGGDAPSASEVSVSQGVKHLLDQLLIKGCIEPVSAATREGCRAGTLVS